MNTLPPNSRNQSVDPDGLEDAWRSMPRKALEYLAEADRLGLFIYGSPPTTRH